LTSTVGGVGKGLGGLGSGKKLTTGLPGKFTVNFELTVLSMQVFGAVSPAATRKRLLLRRKRRSSSRRKTRSESARKTRRQSCRPGPFELQSVGFVEPLGRASELSFSWTRARVCVDVSQIVEGGRVMM